MTDTRCRNQPHVVLITVTFTKEKQDSNIIYTMPRKQCPILNRI